MLAQRCMGWHLTRMVKSHMDSLTDMSRCLLWHKERNDGGGRRTNVQGRPMEGAEVADRCGLPPGTRRRVHLSCETWIAHGNVGGATHISMVFRQDLQTMEIEPPDPLMMLAAPLRKDGKNESGRLSW